MSTSSNKLKTGVKMGGEREKQMVEDRLCERTVCDRAVGGRVVCEIAAHDTERLSRLHVEESCVKGSA